MIKYIYTYNLLIHSTFVDILRNLSFFRKPHNLNKFFGRGKILNGGGKVPVSSK